MNIPKFKLVLLLRLKHHESTLVRVIKLEINLDYTNKYQKTFSRKDLRAALSSDCIHAVSKTRFTRYVLIILPRIRYVNISY